MVLTALATGAARAEVSDIDHYEVGKRLFTERRYAQALEEFRRALAVAPRPEVLYSIAQTQRLLGDCPSAIQTYHAFLAARPGAQLAEYARANIQRCEDDLRTARSTTGQPARSTAGQPARSTTERPAWYRDGVGDAMVGGGLVAGVVGAVVWHAGRSAASDVAGAPDYQTFVQRQAAASSALTEQRVGIATMLVGGAALVAGVVHYVYYVRSPRRAPELGIAVTADSAMLTGSTAF